MAGRIIPLLADLRANDKMSPVLNRVNQQFRFLSVNLRFAEAAGAELTQRFGAMATKAGRSLNSITKSSIRAAKDTEFNLKKIASITGESDQAADKLKRTFLDMGKEIPFSINKLSDVGIVVGRMGEKITGALPGITKLASEFSTVASDMNETKAAEGLSKAIKVLYGSRYKGSNLVEEMNTLASGIIAAADSATTSETDIINFITRMGSAGRNVKLAAYEIIGLGAAAADIGKPAERAGRAYSQLFTSIVKNKDVLSDTLGKTTSEIEEYVKKGQTYEKILKPLFAKFAEEGESSLELMEKLGLGGRSEFINLYKGIGKSLGNVEDKLKATKEGFIDGNHVQKKFQRLTETSKMILQKFNASLENTKTLLGEQILNALNPFIKIATRALNFYNEADVAVKQFMGRTIAVSGAILLFSGTLLTALGGLASMRFFFSLLLNTVYPGFIKANERLSIAIMKVFRKEMLMFSGMISGAVMSVFSIKSWIGVLYTLGTVIVSLSSMVLSFTVGLGMITTALVPIYTVVKKMGPIFNSTASLIGEFFSVFKESSLGILSYLRLVGRHTSSVFDGLDSRVSRISSSIDKFTMKIKGLSSALKYTFSDFRKNFSFTETLMPKFLGFKWEDYGVSKDLVKKTVDSISSIFYEVKTGVKNFLDNTEFVKEFKSGFNYIFSGAMNVASEVRDYVSEIFKPISSQFSFEGFKFDASFIEDVFTAIFQIVKKSSSLVIDSFTTLWESMYASYYLSQLKYFLSNVVDTVFDATQDIFNFDFGGSYTNTVINFFDKAREYIIPAVEFIGRTIRNSIEHLKSGIVYIGKFFGLISQDYGISSNVSTFGKMASVFLTMFTFSRLLGGSFAVLATKILGITGTLSGLIFKLGFFAAGSFVVSVFNELGVSIYDVSRIVAKSITWLAGYTVALINVMGTVAKFVAGVIKFLNPLWVILKTIGNAILSTLSLVGSFIEKTLGIVNLGGHLGKEAEGLSVKVSNIQTAVAALTVSLGALWAYRKVATIFSVLSGFPGGIPPEFMPKDFIGPVLFGFMKDSDKMLVRTAALNTVSKGLGDSYASLAKKTSSLLPIFSRFWKPVAIISALVFGVDKLGAEFTIFGAILATTALPQVLNFFSRTTGLLSSSLSRYSALSDKMSMFSSSASKMSSMVMPFLTSFTMRSVLLFSALSYGFTNIGSLSDNFGTTFAISIGLIVANLGTLNSMFQSTLGFMKKANVLTSMADFAGMTFSRGRKKGGTASAGNWIVKSYKEIPLVSPITGALDLVGVAFRKVYTDIGRFSLYLKGIGTTGGKSGGVLYGLAAASGFLSDTFKFASVKTRSFSRSLKNTDNVFLTTGRSVSWLTSGIISLTNKLVNFSSIMTMVGALKLTPSEYVKGRSGLKKGLELKKFLAPAAVGLGALSVAMMNPLDTMDMLRENILLFAMIAGPAFITASKYVISNTDTISNSLSFLGQSFNKQIGNSVLFKDTFSKHQGVIGKVLEKSSEKIKGFSSTMSNLFNSGSGALLFTKKFAMMSLGLYAAIKLGPDIISSLSESYVSLGIAIAGTLFLASKRYAAVSSVMSVFFSDIKNGLTSIISPSFMLSAGSGGKRGGIFQALLNGIIAPYNMISGMPSVIASKYSSMATSISSNASKLKESILSTTSAFLGLSSASNAANTVTKTGLAATMFSLLKTLTPFAIGMYAIYKVSERTNQSLLDGKMIFLAGFAAFITLLPKIALAFSSVAKWAGATTLATNLATAATVGYGASLNAILAIPMMKPFFALVALSGVLTAFPELTKGLDQSSYAIATLATAAGVLFSGYMGTSFLEVGVLWKKQLDSVAASYALMGKKVGILAKAQIFLANTIVKIGKASSWLISGSMGAALGKVLIVWTTLYGVIYGISSALDNISVTDFTAVIAPLSAIVVAFIAGLSSPITMLTTVAAGLIVGVSKAIDPEAGSEFGVRLGVQLEKWFGEAGPRWAVTLLTPFAALFDYIMMPFKWIKDLAFHGLEMLAKPFKMLLGEDSFAGDAEEWFKSQRSYLDRVEDLNNTFLYKYDDINKKQGKEQRDLLDEARKNSLQVKYGVIQTEDYLDKYLKQNNASLSDLTGWFVTTATRERTDYLVRKVGIEDTFKHIRMAIVSEINKVQGPVQSLPKVGIGITREERDAKRNELLNKLEPLMHSSFADISKDLKVVQKELLETAMAGKDNGFEVTNMFEMSNQIDKLSQLLLKSENETYDRMVDRIKAIQDILGDTRNITQRVEENTSKESANSVITAIPEAAKIAAAESAKKWLMFSLTSTKKLADPKNSVYPFNEKGYFGTNFAKKELEDLNDVAAKWEGDLSLERYQYKMANAMVPDKLTKADYAVVDYRQGVDKGLAASSYNQAASNFNDLMSIIDNTNRINEEESKNIMKNALLRLRLMKYYAEGNKELEPLADKFSHSHRRDIEAHLFKKLMMNNLEKEKLLPRLFLQRDVTWQNNKDVISFLTADFIRFEKSLTQFRDDFGLIDTTQFDSMLEKLKKVAEEDVFLQHEIDRVNMIIKSRQTENDMYKRAVSTGDTTFINTYKDSMSNLRSLIEGKNYFTKENIQDTTNQFYDLENIARKTGYPEFADEISKYIQEKILHMQKTVVDQSTAKGLFDKLKNEIDFRKKIGVKIPDEIARLSIDKLNELKSITEDKKITSISNTDFESLRKNIAENAKNHLTFMTDTIKNNSDKVSDSAKKATDSNKKVFQPTKVFDFVKDKTRKGTQYLWNFTKDKMLDSLNPNKSLNRDNDFSYLKKIQEKYSSSWDQVDDSMKLQLKGMTTEEVDRFMDANKIKPDVEYGNDKQSRSEELRRNFRPEIRTFDKKVPIGGQARATSFSPYSSSSHSATESPEKSGKHNYNFGDITIPVSIKMDGHEIAHQVLKIKGEEVKIRFGEPTMRNRGASQSAYI